MAFAEVTVVGTYLGPNLEPLAGKQIRFMPNVDRVVDSGGGTVAVRGEGVTVTLDATGSFSVPLAATDDPDLTPAGWAWQVKEFFPPGTPWWLVVPAATVGTLDIADAVHYPAAPDLITYPTRTDFDTHVAKTVNVHGITDAAALETKAGAQTKVDTHAAVTTGAHGIPDPATIVVTSDSRLTNSRTPSLHAGSHAAIGNDPITPASIGAAATSHTHLAAAVTDLGGAALLNVGTMAGTVAAGDAPAAAQAAAESYTDTAISTHSGATDPHGDRAAASGALGAHVVAADPHGDRAYAAGIVATASGTAASDLAAHAANVTSVHGIADTSLLETTAGAAGKVAAHAAASDPHGDRYAASSALSTHAAGVDPHGDRAFATSAVSTHTGATDPHGDRSYADGAVSAHSAASDPHGDRAAAGAALSGHVGASDPHGDRAAATGALSAHASATTTVHGIADTSALETTTGSAGKIATHAAATDPHGDRAFATSAASSAVSTHAGAADPHGDRSYTGTALSTHAAAADPHGDRSYASGLVSTHAAVTTSVHGIADTSALETTTGSASKVSTHAAAVDPHSDRAYTDSQLSGHTSATTAVHGIANTGLLETTSGATAKVSAHTGASDPHSDRAYADSAVSTHSARTTSVHGIADVSQLQTVSASTAAINNHAVATDPHGDRAYADAQVATRVPTTRAITAGSGLTGGGSLAADRTFAASGLTSAHFDAGSVDGTAGTASLRTLGTGAQQAAAGTAPAAAQAAAIAASCQRGSNLSDVSSALTSRANLVTGHERTSYVTFGTGVADQKVDLYFTAPAGFHGFIDVRLTGAEQFEVGSGVIACTYQATLGSSSVVRTSQVCTMATGGIASRCTLSPLVWDSVNSRFKVSLCHLTALGNLVAVMVLMRPASASFEGAISTLGVSAVYTTDATVYPALTPWQQPLDADLTTIAALAPSDNSLLQRKSGAWAGRTPAQVKVDLALTRGDVGLDAVQNVARMPLCTSAQFGGYVSPSGGDTAWGPLANTSMYGIGLENRLRIRQNGFATGAILYVSTLTNVSEIRILVWRKNTAGTYDKILDEDVTSQLTAGTTNTVTFTSAYEVREGDYVGSGIVGTNPVGTPLLGRNDGTTPSSRIVLNAVPTDTYDWDTKTLFNTAYLPITVVGLSPSIVGIGDSLMEGASGNRAFTQPVKGWNPLSSPMAWLEKILGMTTQTLGIGGQRTTAIAARFADDVVSLHPTYAILEGGVNDLSAGIAQATVIANFTSMLDACATAGIRPIVAKLAPWTNGTNVQMQTRDVWNAAIVALAANYDAPCVDFDVRLGQHRAGGDSGNLWDIKTVYNADGIHYTPSGYLQYAAAIADVISSL